MATPTTFPLYKPLPVADLIPYARNARTHSDAQVAQIAASIREFGFTNPILVDAERGVIAGHGRLLAARKLGMTEVPTLELGHLTPAQRRAYVLADNRLALSAGWDEDLLRIELGELQADGFDLALTGFDLDEIAAFLAEPTSRAHRSRRRPARPEVPVSRVGRRLAARPPPPGLRRQHRRGHGRARAERRAAAPDGDRPALWRRVRSGLAQPRRPGQRRSGSARSRTTTGPTGARPGRCSRATSPTSGTAPCTRRRWPKAWSRAGSRSGRR